ncbi:MAG TPA: hypothetical protein VHH34_15715 [Pseudonocardiaceae bacterium]|nr:hypothetical protein [Pseudonocardiaceae bacterium]
MTTTNVPTHGQARPGARAWLSRWPSLLGLVAAGAMLLAGADRTTVGSTVAVAAVCYLAAAALNRPWAAWAAIPATTVVIFAGGLLGAQPLVSLAVAAAALVGIGLITRAPRATLTTQSAAMLAYGGLVVIGLAISPTVGLVLVALTLIGHGGWDVLHLRRGTVVPGSLAEACVALDVPLGLAVLASLLIT